LVEKSGRKGYTTEEAPENSKASSDSARQWNELKVISTYEIVNR
jgi:hypothetical protein